ncbi:unnamed protein product [Paramecium sonneborni]|uniref:Non-specific serine/threonine protein kinase n=1 Tax=Paramecium sonneborni TaxID=65129 RepID=A0A8S1N4T7_9CILI|nr:unnamed protein product [Paramecium sonneborni]
MTPQEICMDLPIEFAKALEYIKSLQYQSDPDYDYLIQLFRKLAQSRKIDYDDIYEWTVTNNNTQILNQKQENSIIQVASLQQFERTPISKQNKCHSLKVPSTHDILQDRKRSFQNDSKIQLLKVDDLNKSIENTYQLSQMVHDFDSKQDYISQDDAIDTLFTRYNTLKSQNIEIHHPQNEKKQQSGQKNLQIK